VSADPVDRAAGVRDATTADAPAVVRLMHEMADYFGETSTATEASILEALGDDACGALVAERDGEIVGVVAWFFFRSLFNGKRSAWIEDASVAATHRGTGVGRSLLLAALARLRRSDVAEIGIITGLDNERAKHLYRSLGFVDDGLSLLDRQMGDS
jgi:ribosomal protein S18 acetylase RimI-like enzyme